MVKHISLGFWQNLSSPCYDQLQKDNNIKDDLMLLIIKYMAYIMQCMTNTYCNNFEGKHSNFDHPLMLVVQIAKN